MKKILAIAVATAISAPAMADMTIGGTIAAGWSGDSNTSEGFGIDTAEISVSGSETLDNGVTVSGFLGFENGQEEAPVLGTGSKLSVAGDFGTFYIHSQKSGAYTESYGPADNFVGEFGTEVVADVVAYMAPAMGPVTLVLDTSETGNAIGAGAGDYDLQATALIKLGSFAGRVAYKNVDAGDNRVRLGGTFDLGAVKVGASYQNQDGGYEYTSAGVTVPMGATTLAASIAKKETDAVKLNGTSLAVSHTLSSNVSASVKYNDYDVDASTDNKAVTALVTLTF